MRIKDHNLNPETVETLEENIGKKMKENIGNILQVVRVSQDFPKKDSICQRMEANYWQLYSHKTESLPYCHENNVGCGG